MVSEFSKCNVTPRRTDGMVVVVGMFSGGWDVCLSGTVRLWLLEGAFAGGL